MSSQRYSRAAPPWANQKGFGWNLPATFARYRSMASSLANKWVLITGASSGFGAAAARAFGAEGAKLLLGARRVDRLKQVAGEARKAGAAAAEFQSLDVSQTASVNAFVDWARTRLGGPRKSEPIHVLI